MSQINDKAAYSMPISLSNPFWSVRVCSAFLAAGTGAGQRSGRNSSGDCRQRYVLVPVCPEQLGGMPTPRTSEMLHGTGAQVLDAGLRIIAPETGEDVTQFHIDGARYALEIAGIVGAKRAYLKGGSPSCDRQGVTGEVLTRGGVKVIRIG